MKSTTYVFDLDGVITNPGNSAVETKAVTKIYELLQQGSLVAVNTGRSFEWVDQNFISSLLGMGGHEHFDQLYIVCEKGGESLIWQQDTFLPQPSRFALPNESIVACRQFFNDNANEFTTMFWDGTKKTMATIEKRPESDLAMFHEQQTVLVQKLNDIFKNQAARIDPTTIATDVEFPGAGKHAGAELIYEWATQRLDMNQESFICFGDSTSDYEMARYFGAQGNETTFVFVGKKDSNINQSEHVALVVPNAMYSEGTLEYFAM